MLHIKRICSETSGFIRNYKDLKDSFMKQGYKPEFPDYHFERAMCVDRKLFLQNK